MFKHHFPSLIAQGRLHLQGTNLCKMWCVISRPKPEIWMDPHYKLHRPGYWTLFLRSPSAVCFAITFKLKPNSWMLPLGPKVALPMRDLEDLTKKRAWFKFREIVGKISKWFLSIKRFSRQYETPENEFCLVSGCSALPGM